MNKENLPKTQTMTVSFGPALCPRWLIYSMGMGMGVPVSEERREAAVTGVGAVVLKCLGLRTTLGVVWKTNDGCGALTWHTHDCFGKCRATDL